MGMYLASTFEGGYVASTSLRWLPDQRCQTKNLAGNHITERLATSQRDRTESSMTIISLKKSGILFWDLKPLLWSVIIMNQHIQRPVTHHMI